MTDTTDTYMAPAFVYELLTVRARKIERLTVAINLAERLGSALRARRAHIDAAADLPAATIEALIVELESLAEYYGF